MSNNVIWWNKLCGNVTEDHAFWSPTITLNTTDPDLTQCFQQTAVSLTPSIFLWINCLWYIPYLHFTKSVNSLKCTSRFNGFKVLLCCLLVVVCLLELTFVAVDHTTETTHYLVDFLSPSFLAFTYLLSGFLTNYEFRKGVHSGGVLFIFWVLSVFLEIIPFRSNIRHIVYNEDTPTKWQKVDYSMYYIRYSLLLTLLVCSLFSDKKALPKNRQTHDDERQPLLQNHSFKEDEKHRRNHPLECAPFWKRITILWMTGFIIKGYRCTLQFCDMWNLLEDATSEVAMADISKQWGKEVDSKKYKMVIKQKDLSQNNNDTIRKHEKCCPMPKKPSFLAVLAKTIGPFYMTAAFYHIFSTLLAFANPFILSLLISFIDNGDPYVWHGYFYIVLMYLCSQLKSIFNQNYWLCLNYTAIRVRTAIIGIVYRKALRLNNDARNSSTTGEIVNLMTVDAEKVRQVTIWLHQVWLSPLTITLALYFLWQLLGPSAMAGFILMLLVIPFNAFLAEKSRQIQVKQMLLKDQRMKALNEVLSGIKVLKLYGWENAFRDHILDIRKKELSLLRKAQFYSAGIHVSWNIAPYVVALGTFGAYTLSSPEHILDANKAFVSLTLFNLLNTPISALPELVMDGMQALVAIDRINKFLRNTELDDTNVQKQSPGLNDVISMENGTFSWSITTEPVLNKMNFNISEGSLVAIVGQVGCGKSSLISALIGETELLSGSVAIRGSVAYTPQQAWIQNDTMKNNILFGKELNQNVYEKVIEACALLPDLEILPGYDEVEIGENGINLSGGQKQRVSLARAVYQDSDIYLLDDPLAAVDTHVGKYIFENVIGPTGMLKHKTRILVTNSVTVLPQTDIIICLKNGILSEIGSFAELISHAGAFAEYIDTYLKEKDSLESDQSDEELNIRKEIKSQLSQISNEEKPEEYCADSKVKQGEEIKSVDTKKKGIERKKAGRRLHISSSVGQSTNDFTRKTKIKDTKSKLVREEAVMSGAMKFSNFVDWIKSCGLKASFATLLFYMISISAELGANIWLSKWSSDYPTANGTQNIELRNLRLGVYGGLGLLQAIGVLGQALCLAVATVQSSKILHNQLLTSVVRAPMAFYDVTPLGRIVNRFSNDLNTLDVNIPMQVRVWMGTFSTIVTTYFIISFSTPIFLVVIIPLSIFYFFVQRFYTTTSRQLKRIESVRRSPIYSHFSETLSGASSIRSYGYANQFIEKSDLLMNQFLMVSYPKVTAIRWLGIMMEFVGSCTVLFSGLFAVMQRDTISPAIAGLSISYALRATGILNIWIRMTSELEQQIISIERIQEYTDCPQEAPDVIQGNTPDESWPNQGCIQFDNFKTRYRPGLDLVLKGISCNITPKEKVGVVGRTGAGKSSLSLSLFRIIEAVSGRITVDGVNIAMIGLHDLRAKLTIIPQDPVIFSGTIRMNLDPFTSYQDTEIWLALEQAHLKEYVQSLQGGLQYLCSEGGENLSVGQRQLICLARALLRRTHILVLDEATAGVDLETDDLIQSTIKSEFSNSTVITIAHRINTIMDYDRILVLDQGEIVEFDKPSTLLGDTNSVFYSLAESAKLV